MSIFQSAKLQKKFQNLQEITQFYAFLIKMGISELSIKIRERQCLPMEHSLKINNIGVFSLALEFNDKKDESEDTKEEKKAVTKKKYNHVRAKGINFRVDKSLGSKDGIKRKW